MTLDPLVRRVRLPDRRELLVSDTVGFIDRLPHTLVAAFRATLEEVVAADLLLHVIDAAAPGREHRMAAVRRDAGGGGRRATCRRSTCSTSATCSTAASGSAWSARSGRALHLGGDRRWAAPNCSTRSPRGSRSTSAASSSDSIRRIEADRERLAQIYRFGRVVQHIEHDGQVSIEADVPRRLWSRLQAREEDADE